MHLLPKKSIHAHANRRYSSMEDRMMVGGGQATPLMRLEHMGQMSTSSESCRNRVVMVTGDVPYFVVAFLE